MKQKVVKRSLSLGLGCLLFFACSIGMKAEQLQSTNLNVAPPLTTSLDLATQSSTLVDPADVRLCGTGCTGTAGAISIITNDTLPTLSFQLTNGGTDTGEAYLAVLVPAGGSLPSFTVNGNGPIGLASSTFSSGAFTDFLAANMSNLSLASGSGVNADFSAFATATGQATTTPGSFQVYVYAIGAFNGGTLPISFGNISAFPTGTILWGFLTNQACSTGSCVLTDTTPLSEAVTITPEPATAVLVGSGFLLLLAGTLRRRWAEG